MWSRYANNYVTILSQTLLVNIFQSSGSGRKLVLCTWRSCKYAVSFIYTFTATLKLVLILLVSKWWPSQLCPSVWMSAKKVIVVCVQHCNYFEEFLPTAHQAIHFTFLLSVFGFYCASFNTRLDSLLTIIRMTYVLTEVLPCSFLSCNANVRV
jgi:hypothetical protein